MRSQLLSRLSAANLQQGVGPSLRLMSYGWGYAAQFALTLMLGVESFAVYVAATALGMIGAYASMAGVTDLLTRQWSWLIASRTNLVSALASFVAPRLALAFVVPAALAFLLERNSLIEASGDSQFWLLVGCFGVLSVTIDLCGVMLACLGKPSFHIIVSNGLLGTSFFMAAGWALLVPGSRPDVVLSHVLAQVGALVIIGGDLAVLLLQATRASQTLTDDVARRPDLSTGVTITAVHLLEIARAHLPILVIQAVFPSTIASALVTSWRFSRAADVMSTLAIAQYTRAMISEPRSDVEASRCRAQRLCMILTTAAMVPIATVVITICQRESLGISATAFIAGTVVISGMLRQVTAIEIWMAKVVHNPGPALRIGLVVEAARIGAFSLIAYLASSLYASVAALVICDAVLLLAMLRQSRKSRIDA